MLLEDETPEDQWLVVENPELSEALKIFGSQLLDHYN
jgi:hypothetical protein